MAAAAQRLSWAANVMSAGAAHDEATQFDRESVISSWSRVPRLQVSRVCNWAVPALGNRQTVLVAVTTESSNGAVTKEQVKVPATRKQQQKRNLGKGSGAGGDLQDAADILEKGVAGLLPVGEAQKPQARKRPAARSKKEQKAPEKLEVIPVKGQQKKVLEEMGSTQERITSSTKSVKQEAIAPVPKSPSAKASAATVKRQRASRSKASPRQKLEEKVESPSAVETTKRATAAGKQRIPSSQKNINVENSKVIKIEGESEKQETADPEEIDIGNFKVEDEQVLQDDNSTENIEFSSEFEEYLDHMKEHNCKNIRDDLFPEGDSDTQEEEELEEIGVEEQAEELAIDVHVAEESPYDTRKRLVQVRLQDYIASLDQEDSDYPAMEQQEPRRTTGRDTWVRPAGPNLEVNPAVAPGRRTTRDVWINPAAMASAAAANSTSPRRPQQQPHDQQRRFGAVGNAHGQPAAERREPSPIHRRRIISPPIAMPAAGGDKPNRERLTPAATSTEERDRPGRRYPKAYYDEKGAIPHHIPQVVRWPNMLHPVKLKQDDQSRSRWKKGDAMAGARNSSSDSSKFLGITGANRPEIVTIIVIGGPTAVGKSALGIALAKKLGGEIISADSVQVYRGLDVGSAKSTMEERQGIPHHLLDIASPDPASSYNGRCEFAAHAWQAVRAVVARGNTPIVVGGSRMYTRWFVEAGASVRNCKHQLQVEYRVLCYSLWKPYDMVYERIDERCEEMVVQGMLEEAAWLLDMGVQPSSTSASRAIGYRQAMRFLDESRGLDGATSRSRFLAFLTLVQETSREFARNQLAGFGGDARFQSLNGMRPLEEILRVVEADVAAKSGEPPGTDSDACAELQRLERVVKAPWKGQGGEYAEFYETKLRVFSRLENCDKVVEWVKRTQTKIRGREQRFQGWQRSWSLNCFNAHS